MALRIEKEQVIIENAPNFVEKTILSFVRPHYYCFGCGEKKRKFVSAFEIENFKKNKQQRYEFSNPVCENCFEFEFHGKILNDFYETDIY